MNTIEDGKFAILLATFNGCEFLEEQLESIHNQSVANIDVWVSDDGSTDDTLAIAGAWAKKWKKGRFTIIQRPQKPNNSNISAHPFPAIVQSNDNFNSLISNEEIDADFFAFCDQDDIWHLDKLKNAADFFQSVKPAIPALFCSRTRIIDRNGEVAGYSPLFSRRPDFSNAIVQNIAAGNTIVMNNSAMNSVRSSVPDADYVSHDWWCYLVISAIGGVVHYSPVATVDYRQHANNLIGENASWKARMIRMKFVVTGRFARWNEQNLNALKTIEPHIRPENLAIIEQFTQIRNLSGFRSMIKLFSSAVHRQTFLGQIALYFAAFIKRI